MSKRNKRDGRRTGAKYVLPKVGTTTDGRTVVAGVYEFHETYGMPLEFLFFWLSENNMIPDWLDFYRWAINNNMRHKRILIKLKDPIEDAYGVDFAAEVFSTLNKLKEIGYFEQSD